MQYETIVKFEDARVKREIRNLIENDGWIEGQPIHEHALLCLGLDHALDNDLYPCDIGTKIETNEVKITRKIA